ncbi:MAG: SpoIIE family protein phosphatase [Clostridia bacterium]|nr:SpoIIE family protein phosphatase [Clostridia bacterium]
MIKKIQSSLSFNIISSVVLLLLIFSFIVSIIGYIRFTESLTTEYNDSAFRTAETAAALINTDRIEEYLEIGGDDDEYRLSLERLNTLCNKQNVSIIYTIAVDTTDYGHFKSVFNSVNDNSGYTPWEVGHLRETTNDEYKKIYKEMYENGLQRGTVIRDKNLNGTFPHITSLIPLKGSDGKVKAILCVQRPMEQLMTGIRAYLRSVSITMIILAVLASVTAAIYLRRHFVTPVKKISAEAERFASENLIADENALKDISKINEISVLASSIEKMEADTVRHIDNITAITADKERMGTELSIATKIQEGSIPSVFPPYPDRKEFDIYASMTPAKEVGGDFYDFFLIDDDHLALVMADVSGKGVPAALFMMVTKILISEIAKTGVSTNEVLSVVNKRICEHNKAGMFVTVWLGILEISTGILRASNAGHEYPVIKRADGKFELFKDKHGFVVGGMEGIKYKEYELKLSKGDSIFLYTDGVTEATNANSELFGNDRLVSALNENGNCTPEELLGCVKNSIDKFVGEAPQFDDITMMSLQYFGGSKVKELTINATVENIEKVTDFINEQLESYNCPMKAQMQIDVAIDELFGNIAHYAYNPDVGPATVRVEVEPEPLAVVITFIDNGKPYDPLKKTDPDVTLSAEDREIGGLGIFLVKKTMDDITYEYKNGQNILKIKKSI